MSEFFSMGGYAAYVWPSYAVTVLAGLAVGLHSLRRYRRARQLVEKLERERTRSTGAPVE
ncbi:MAG: heme exporter protein CcmD [Alphaproteobacteria bacterium]